MVADRASSWAASSIATTQSGKEVVDPFRTTWLDTSESVRPDRWITPSPGEARGARRMTPTVVARSSRAEMAVAGSPFAKAHGADTGSSTMWNQGDRAVEMTPFSSRTGRQPPTATDMPSALASTRRKGPLGAARGRTGIVRL